MGYSDPSRQSAFQNKWLKDRREAWLKANGPCKKCKTWEKLRVIKDDPSIKTVKVFGWSEAGREEVLKKCKVLCQSCARKHYGAIFKKKYSGKMGEAEVLSAVMVWSIRGRLFGRESIREIARFYGVHHSTVMDIQHGRAWAWLKVGRRKVFGLLRHKK